MAEKLFVLKLFIYGHVAFLNPCKPWLVVLLLLAACQSRGAKPYGKSSGAAGDAGRSGGNATASNGSSTHFGRRRRRIKVTAELTLGLRLICS